MEKQIIRNTKSVCPICLRQIPAVHVQRGNDIYLEKKCKDHGEFSTVIWRGTPSMTEWRGCCVPELKPDENLCCPHECGICSEHMQGTCCVLLEITDRCNLNCEFCFANSGEKKDPSLLQVKEWLVDISRQGGKLVQLSGGEPTLRDDLQEIVAAAKAVGIEYIQLNTNGIRLAEEPEFVKKLAEAGLSFVFMQFDGMNDAIYEKLRGKPLLSIKKKAIENCGEQGIGVTLVPTIVPGVNDHNIGEIVRFAVSKSPEVRGVHFQPVSYFGRYPTAPEDSMRITLPEVLAALEKQTDGLIETKNIAQSHCDHAMCGFHGAFVVWPKEIEALTRRTKEKNEEPCFCDVDMAAKNRQFIAKRWERKREKETESCCCGKKEERSMDEFLARAQSHSFTITAMAFQDCWNLDIERLRQCSLHVYDSGKLTPFCAHYLTANSNE